MGVGNIDRDRDQADLRRTRKLAELCADYEDYLRVHRLAIWSKDSPEAHFVRLHSRIPDAGYESFREYCETRSAEVVANIALCLIHQANYLLDAQIRRLERDFISKGGVRERMTRIRLQERKSNKPRP